MENERDTAGGRLVQAFPRLTIEKGEAIPQGRKPGFLGVVCGMTEVMPCSKAR